ncbi:MAG: oligosaccharide flippase family protein, partial [Anaerolineae bacterium]
RIEVLPDADALATALGSFDPAATALLTAVPDDDIWRDRPPTRAFTPGSTRVTSATRNHLAVDVYTPRAGLLIVNEAYFPGWRAWVTYAAREQGGRGGRGEKEVPVYRADGMLRGIPVPAGRSTVRLRYFPLSVKVGLYGSFLGGLLLVLAAAYAVWTRFVDIRRGDQARLIAINSVGPMAAALLNKVVDFAFAMLMLRVLGPEDAGKYYTAITIISFADIFTNFGLNLLTTREVARHPDEAPSYLTQTSILRLGLWVVALPLLGAYVLYRAAAGSPLGTDTVGTLAIMAVALVPSNLNSALASIFQGFERMVVPAAITIASNFLRVTLGAVVLLLGFGFLGLAGVSLVVNWVTFGILAVLLVREGVRPALAWRPTQLKTMAGVSLPFMLNHLLQTVFFKVDVLLLSQLMGNTVVGWYQAAYKWVDALLIIPGYFTMALFPMMSRRGETDRPALARAYGRAVRWLLSLALPISLLTTFLAEDLVRILGGAEYLPAGAIVLQVMIWFLPLSFANGIAQYVLLALNRQRLVTPSFVVAVAFNVGANLWAIPRYGYVGAAVVTILSELALLVPFTWALRDLGTPPLVVAIWRPAMATSLMGAVLVGLTWPPVATPPLVAAILAAAVYAVALVRLGGITPDDRRLIVRL